MFLVPDQRAERIARLLCDEIVPLFGVPEALLSDRGANLLSHLMLDICRLLGIDKLNTTAYHPECDGMVERFNHTLKRKRAAQFGNQWDRHLPALLWAYRNALHDTTGEKPSFHLFGWDCRSPTEAALLPVTDVQPTAIEDYSEELILTLSSARKTALDTIRKAQRQYKKTYDRKSDNYSYRVEQWVSIHFPSEETGHLQKLSRPWRGPYRITSCNETNVTAVKVYFPRDYPIQVHQLRVKRCPHGFPAGFFCYGNKRKGPGRSPRWVESVLAGCEPTVQTDHSVPEVDSDYSSPPNDDGAPPAPDIHASGENQVDASRPLRDGDNTVPVPDDEHIPLDDVRLDSLSSTDCLQNATNLKSTDDITTQETSVEHDVPEHGITLNTDREAASHNTTGREERQARIGYSLRQERQPPDRLM